MLLDAGWAAAAARRLRLRAARTVSSRGVRPNGSLLPVFLDWPRCNALRDGVVSALPDGALVPVPQGCGAHASAECSPKARSLLLLQKAASWWLVAAPRVDAPAADVNPPTRLSTRSFSFNLQSYAAN